MTSSVIFLGLIATWIAYLVPKWMSRREDVCAARVDDRFSESIRVLGHREPKQRGSSTQGYLLTRNASGLSEVSLTDTRRVDAAPGQLGRCGVRRGLVVMLAVSVLAGAVLIALAVTGVGHWPVAVAGLIVPAAAVTSLRWRVRRRRPAQAVVGTVLRRPDVSATAAERDDVVGHSSRVHPGEVLHDEHALVAAETEAARVAARVAADARDADLARRRAEVKDGEWLPTAVPLPAYLLKPAAPRRVEPVVIDLRDRVVDVRDQRERGAGQEAVFDHAQFDRPGPTRGRGDLRDLEWENLRRAAG